MYLVLFDNPLKIIVTLYFKELKHPHEHHRVYNKSLTDVWLKLLYHCIIFLVFFVVWKMND